MVDKEKKDTKPKILVVDDSVVVLSMLRDRFHEEGFGVFMARNGVEGLKIALRENPDVIISDVEMPEMDGWEFCEHVRALPEITNIPFIFLTQFKDVPLKVRGLRLGADDYITKPFSKDELVARVWAIVKKKKEMESKILMTGSLKAMGLPELLQVYEMNKKTAVMKFKGEKRGEIYFLNGKIVHALTPTKKGREAIFEMLKYEDADFVIAPYPIDEEVPQTIKESVQDLILEGARLMDEENRDV